MTLIERTTSLGTAIGSLDGTMPGFDEEVRPHLAEAVVEWCEGAPPSPFVYEFDSVQASRSATHLYDTDRDLTPAELASVATAMERPESGLEVVAFVRHVPGVRTGLHLWNAGALGLLSNATQDEDERREWVLQLEFARAPAFLAVVGNLDACGDSMHAYRQMMVTAGSMCQEGWLRAVSLGLVGTVFAGLLHGGIWPLGFDGLQRNALCAFAFGHPPSPPKSS